MAHALVGRSRLLLVVSLAVFAGVATSAPGGPDPLAARQERDIARQEARALKSCPGAAAFAVHQRIERRSAGKPSIESQASRPALRDALVELAVKDQALRHATRADERGPSHAFRSASQVLSHKAVLLLADRFPTLAEVGRDGVDAAWLLVQHAGVDAPDFQHRMLAQIEATPQAFGFRNGEPALLADKVLVARGAPQRYGTQFELRSGRYAPLPIEAPANVDARRAAVGLMPLADYDCFLNVFLGR
jgi:hypothetical protein